MVVLVLPRDCLRFPCPFRAVSNNLSLFFYFSIDRLRLPVTVEVLVLTHRRPGRGSERDGQWARLNKSWVDSCGPEI